MKKKTFFKLLLILVNFFGIIITISFLFPVSKAFAMRRPTIGNSVFLFGDFDQFGHLILKDSITNHINRDIFKDVQVYLFTCKFSNEVLCWVEIIINLIIKIKGFFNGCMELLS